MFFLLLSFFLAGLILTDIWPNLRGPAPETSEWYWPHLLRPVDRWWPGILIGSLTVLFGLWWIPRRKLHDAIPLLLLIFLNIGLQLAFIYADRPNVGAELVDRTLSKASNGYLATAGEIEDMNAALNMYPDLMPTFDNDHARTHPPGLVLAHWATDHTLRRLPFLAESLARPATVWRCTDLWVLSRPPATAASLLLWSWVPVLFAALTAVPAYLLARRWYCVEAARLSAILAATLPALLIFSPTPDQMFAFLGMVSLYLLILGLHRKNAAIVITSGLVVSIMSFLSLGNLAWAGLLGAYTLWWFIKPVDDPSNTSAQKRNSWGLVIAFVAGVASVWLVYWLIWGVAPWIIARVGLQQHYDLVTSLRRYDWWFGYNLIDFLLFAGPPIVVGYVWYIVLVLRKRSLRLDDVSRLAILLGALLALIHVAGSTRGEVGRLWLVFMPLAALIAGGRWAGSSKEKATPILIISAQIILAVSMAFGWRPFFAVILPVERPAMTLVIQPEVIADLSLTTTGGRSVTLIGFDPPPTTSDRPASVPFSLYWDTDGPTLVPYTIFIHLVNEANLIVAQSDSWPLVGQWPMTCWVPGEKIADRHEIQIPLDILSGKYRVIIGVYDPATGERLLFDNETETVTIGEILVQ